MKTRRARPDRSTPAPEEILRWPDTLVQALAFRTIELMEAGKTRGQAALQAYRELRERST